MNAVAALTNHAQRVQRWAAVALGFTIPISTALDNIVLVLLAACWLAAGNLREKIASSRENPVALTAFALFGLLVLGLAYGQRYPGDGLLYLGKYADLLFIPLFVVLFRDPWLREQGIRAFCVAMLLTFVVAQLIPFGLLENNPVLPRDSSHPGAFKGSITHGLLAAFAAFVFALLAREERLWPRRLAYIVFALIAVQNVLFVAISRTAYLVLAVLVLYFFTIALGPKRFFASLLASAALAGIAYWGSDTLQQRVHLAAEEIAEWKPGEPAETSAGLRLEWYRASLGIVRDQPVFGSGTGAFPRAYKEALGDRGAAASRNPHNEFLLVAIQIGLLGLAALLALFYLHWRLAPRLATPLECRLARGLVLMIGIACLFNSSLLDHTEGLLYAWMTGLLFGGLQSNGNG